MVKVTVLLQTASRQGVSCRTPRWCVTLYGIGSLLGHGPVIRLLAAMDFPTAVIDPQNETSL